MKLAEAAGEWVGDGSWGKDGCRKEGRRVKEGVGTDRNRKGTCFVNACNRRKQMLPRLNLAVSSVFHGNRLQWDKKILSDLVKIEEGNNKTVLQEYCCR